MKKVLIILGFYLISLTGFAQSKLLFVSTSEEAIQLAKQDIASGTPHLLLQSGFVVTEYTTDKSFENKYNVSYYDFGCMGPEKSFLKEYNKVIVQYLTEKYGKNWLKEIRKDIVGFDDFAGC